LEMNMSECLLVSGILTGYFHRLLKHAKSKITVAVLPHTFLYSAYKRSVVTLPSTCIYCDYTVRRGQLHISVKLFGSWPTHGRLADDSPYAHLGSSNAHFSKADRKLANSRTTHGRLADDSPYAHFDSSYAQLRNPYAHMACSRAVSVKSSGSWPTRGRLADDSRTTRGRLAICAFGFLKCAFQ
jgi:hypothetical protein